MACRLRILSELGYPEDGVLVRVEGHRAAVHVQITLQGFEVEPVLSLGTKRNCVSRLVASSISTNKVQAAPRPSNQRWSPPSIWISSR